VPDEGVAICLDGGELAPGPVSTVLDPETGRILREGAVGRAEIEAIRAGSA
jgi:tRNA A37 threonylcarbamoyladenosine synthetase subunit TsaC/SUA5/YrdC